VGVPPIPPLPRSTKGVSARLSRRVVVVVDDADAKAKMGPGRGVPDACGCEIESAGAYSGDAAAGAATLLSAARAALLAAAAAVRSGSSLREGTAPLSPIIVARLRQRLWILAKGLMRTNRTTERDFYHPISDCNIRRRRRPNCSRAKRDSRHRAKPGSRVKKTLALSDANSVEQKSMSQRVSFFLPFSCFVLKESTRVCVSGDWVLT
jgi:hypothetical protein